MLAGISRYRMSILCSLLLVGAVFIAHPLAEMGVDDDWSYIWSARVLADTGHIVYNGWATAILGWQLYLGALFIKLFGFSFLAARASVLFVAVLTVALTQRLLVRLGISEWNATVGTSLVTLSPVFLSAVSAFMSDVPGLFAIVLCLYACTRAIQAGSTKKIICWLVFASVSNVVLGTVRQVSWLGVLAVVPTTALHLRHKPRVLMITVITWLVSVVAIALCMQWFSHQPYSLKEALIHMPHGHLIGVWRNIILRNTLALSFFSLPLLAAFVVNSPTVIKRVTAKTASLCVIVAGLLLSGFTLGHGPLELQFTNNTVIQEGLTSASGILGAQPNVMPYRVRMILSLLTLGGIVGFCLFLSGAHRDTDWKGRTAFSWRDTAALLGPFTLAYIALLVTRASIFDRYLLPLIPVVTVCLLRLYEQKIGGRLPSVTIFLGLLFGAFGVAVMHDVYARDRAILAVTDEILSTGVNRSGIRGGFEYDSWTQLQNSGYVNDPRLVVPSGAYKLLPSQQGMPPCQSWFADLTPSLSIRYALAYDQSTCYTPSSFAPVTFQAWLPAHKRTIYVQEVPMPTAVCGSNN